MPGRIVVALVAGIVVGAGATFTWAAEVPVAGAKLVLKRGAGGEKLVLVLRDPALPVPPPGSADDPAQHTGLLVTLIGRTAPPQSADLFAPSGFGTPGWSERAGTAGRHLYRNGAAPAAPSPIRRIRLDDKGLKIVAREVGLALAGPQSAVAVIVDMGATRICAVFDGAAIRRDEANLFVGRKAPAPAIATCDVDALLGIPCETSETCSGVCPGGAECGGEPLLGCECVSADQPCGDTDPVCNGECPVGEACSNIGGVPYSSCGCLPVGSTGCGTVYPVCGDGDCPAGLDCNLTTFTCCGGATLEGCACTTGPPPPPCGGTCPESWQCLVGPGLELCIPHFGSGGGAAPTCGGTCTGPAVCTPVVGQCFCVEPCNDGTPYPTCGGTCSDPTATCRPDPEGVGFCFCGP